MTSLQMLWERSDPATALHERFGFPDAPDAVAWVGRVLAEEYGLRLVHCERIVMSHLNALAWVQADDGERLVVKWTPQASEFQRLGALAEIVAWLAEHGVPASTPIPSARGGRQVERDGVSLGVQRVIEADLLDVSDAGEVHAAGAMLARLHQVLDACPSASRIEDDGPGPRPLRDRVLGWVEEHPPQLTPDLAEGVRRLVAQAGDAPAARQLVHGDYRSANVLCRDHQVVGILDLEEARWDLPVVELARQSVLIGTRYHDWGPVPESTRHLLRQGYEQVRPLTPQEAAWLPALTLWFTLLMVPPDDDPTGWGRSALDQLGQGTASGQGTRVGP